MAGGSSSSEEITISHPPTNGNRLSTAVTVEEWRNCLRTMRLPDLAWRLLLESWKQSWWDWNPWPPSHWSETLPLHHQATDELFNFEVALPLRHSGVILALLLFRDFRHCWCSNSKCIWLVSCKTIPLNIYLTASDSAHAKKHTINPKPNKTKKPTGLGFFKKTLGFLNS